MLPIGDDDSQVRIFPFVTYALIALNIAVFFLEVNGGDSFIMSWAFIPRRFVQDPLGSWATLFTSMFMHAGLIHLGGNMLYLAIFGNNVEDRFHHAKYLVFYILSGLGATSLQLYFSLDSGIPNLGASGAIAGVLGSYVLIYPGRRVSVLLGRAVVHVPAIIVIGFWFVLQLFSGVSTIASISETGGVAYMAHIGGFITGLLLTLALR